MSGLSFLAGLQLPGLRQSLPSRQPHAAISPAVRPFQTFCSWRLSCSAGMLLSDVSAGVMVIGLCTPVLCPLQCSLLGTTLARAIISISTSFLITPPLILPFSNTHIWNVHSPPGGWSRLFFTVCCRRGLTEVGLEVDKYKEAQTTDGRSAWVMHEVQQGSVERGQLLCTTSLHAVTTTLHRWQKVNSTVVCLCTAPTLSSPVPCLDCPWRLSFRN